MKKRPNEEKWSSSLEKHPTPTKSDLHQNTTQFRNCMQPTTTICEQKFASENRQREIAYNNLQSIRHQAFFRKSKEYTHTHKPTISHVKSVIEWIVIVCTNSLLIIHWCQVQLRHNGSSTREQQQQQQPRRCFFFFFFLYSENHGKETNSWLLIWIRVLGGGGVKFSSSNTFQHLLLWWW